MYIYIYICILEVVAEEARRLHVDAHGASGVPYNNNNDKSIRKLIIIIIIIIINYRLRVSGVHKEGHMTTGHRVET